MCMFKSQIPSISFRHNQHFLIFCGCSYSVNLNIIGNLGKQRWNIQNERFHMHSTQKNHAPSRAEYKYSITSMIVHNTSTIQDVKQLGIYLSSINCCICPYFSNAKTIFFSILKLKSATGCDNVGTTRCEGHTKDYNVFYNSFKRNCTLKIYL